MPQMFADPINPRAQTAIHCTFSSCLFTLKHIAVNILNAPNAIPPDSPESDLDAPTLGFHFSIKRLRCVAKIHTQQDAPAPKSKPLNVD